MLTTLKFWCSLEIKDDYRQQAVDLSSNVNGQLRYGQKYLTFTILFEKMGDDPHYHFVDR